MYDELVKRLREKAGAFDYDGRPDIACDYEQAADAIEELNKQHEQQRQNLIALMNEKPRWIPVTERLPEEYENVLLLSMSGEIISGYYDSEYKSYCDMSGFRKLCTHWMPLPEPPKEE